MFLKLLLNTKDFDNKLNKSGKELDNFAKKGGAGIDKLLGSLGKIAGVAGVAYSGFELIKKGIDSSQTGTDAWGRTMEGVKTVTDELIYSISNFDGSALFNGLDSLIDRAKDLYDAFDKLANVQMSASFGNTLDQGEFKRLMVTARNKQLSPEERQAALEQAKVLAERMEETTRAVSEASMDAVVKSFAAKAGVDAGVFDPKIIEDAFRLDARAFGDAEREKSIADYKKYKDELKEINKQYADKGFTTEHGTFITEDNSAKRAELQREAAEKYAEAITKYIALQKLSDEELKKLMDTYVSSVQAMNQASESMGQTNEVTATMTAEAAAKAKKAAEEAEKAAAKAKEEAAIATEAANVYAGAASFDTGMVQGVKLDNSDIAQINFVGKGAARRYSVADPRAGLPKTIGMIDTGKLMENIKLPESAQGSKLAESAEGFGVMSDAVNALSDAFDTLGTSEENAVGMLFNFVDAAGQAISKTLEMISYIAAETAARRASQNAATGEAAAKTMAKWAAVPGGIAIATAAIGSIIAAINAIPKFAEGGIVTSATLGVFGEAGPEAVMPLDKLNDFVGSRDVRVTGRIVGQGKDLAVIIDNYNKVRRVKP